MKNSILSLLIAFVGFVASSCAQEEAEVKNIILMIGDGMGVAQVYAGYTVNRGALQLERATYTGFAKTSSSSHYITDSGAGATAISIGKKTYNYAIGVNTEGESEETILESAVKNHLATGLVSTSKITHATPASFIAHDTSRHNYEAIAADFIGSGIDIFIGGGRDDFELRSDSLNLSDSLRALDYSVEYDLTSINTSGSNRIACLAAPGHMPSMLEGRGDFLVTATEISLQHMVKNEKGFFIMIEGSQIDWGGHDNDIDYVVSEMIDFDKAVGKAFDFADENPGTLVIVTADHETGGLALIGGDISSGKVQAAFSTLNHTSVMVPVFAYGAGAENFTGMYENTEIYHRMMYLLQLGK